MLAIPAPLIALAFGALVFILGVMIFRLELPKERLSLEGDETLGQNALTRYLGGIDADLAEAGLEYGAWRFILLSWMVAIVVGLVIGAVLAFPLVGIAVALAMGLWWIRSRWIGAPARKMREQTTRYAAEAAREISAAIIAGSNADAAIRGYHLQVSRRVGATPNRVGERLGRAIAASQSMRAEEAYRAEAAGLGNRAFSVLVEAYLMTNRFGDTQVESAMRQVASEIESELYLRDQRRTTLQTIAGSVVTVGRVIAFVVVITMFLMKPALTFYQSPIGQIALIGGMGWWYVGFLRIKKEQNADED